MRNKKMALGQMYNSHTWPGRNDSQPKYTEHSLHLALLQSNYPKRAARFRTALIIIADK